MKTMDAAATPVDWRKQIDVGLYDVIHCCHAVVPHMARQSSGRIINLVGDSARLGESGLAVTAASRGGVLALTESLAKGPRGITVNALAFDLVETTRRGATPIGRRSCATTRSADWASPKTWRPQSPSLPRPAPPGSPVRC